MNPEQEQKNQDYNTGFDYGTLYAKGLMDEPCSFWLSNEFLRGFQEACGMSYYKIFNG